MLDKKLRLKEEVTVRKINILFFICLLLIMSMTCFANEKDTIFPPAPSSNIYLQDYSRVTNEETHRIVMQTSTSLKKATTAEVAVVLIDSLNNMPIQEYSLGLLRKWGIGNKDKNNGVLILVVTSTRQIRIEVGYGLEGVLTDAKCGEIIREKMLPFIQHGDFNNGIIHGYLSVAGEVAREYRAKSTFPTENPSLHSSYENWFLSLSFFYQTIIFFTVGLLIYLFPRILPPYGKVKGTSKAGGKDDLGGSGGFGGFGGGGGGGFGGGSGGGGGANS